jgi:hypothetical protein
MKTKRTPTTPAPSLPKFITACERLFLNAEEEAALWTIPTPPDMEDMDRMNDLLVGLHRRRDHYRRKVSRLGEQLTKLPMFTDPARVALVRLVDLVKPSQLQHVRYMPGDHLDAKFRLDTAKIAEASVLLATIKAGLLKAPDAWLTNEQAMRRAGLDPHSENDRKNFQRHASTHRTYSKLLIRRRLADGTFLYDPEGVKAYEQQRSK